MSEEWKTIKGYEGLYEVSTLGRVKSLDRYVNCCYGSKQLRKGRLIRFIHKPNGYLMASLCKSGNRKNFYVHRLVAEAFLEKQEGKDFVNHIDRDRKNNNLNNLEWVNVRENILYSLPYRKKRNNCYHGIYGYAIRKRKGAYEVGLDKKYIGRFKTLEEAEKARDNYLKSLGEKK